MSRWETRELLGCGGVAEVRRAEKSGKTQVAIKRLHDRVAPGLSNSLEEEARITACLDHPNIVQVLNVTQDDSGHKMLVMELVRGVNLAELMRSGLLPVGAAIFIIRQLLEALEHVHQHGIVHRDVSPENVIVAWDGSVKLTDFGIAKRVDSEVTEDIVKGKFRYIAPERLDYLPADTRSDLYSIGVMLYELLTGERLFGNHDNKALAEQLISPEEWRPGAVRPEVPEAVDEVVVQLLSVEPGERPQRAMDVLAMLPAPALGRSELITELRARRGDGKLTPVEYQVQSERTGAPPVAASSAGKGKVAMLLVGLAAGAFGGLYLGWHSGENEPVTTATVAKEQSPDEVVFVPDAPAKRAEIQHETLVAKEIESEAEAMPAETTDGVKQLRRDDHQVRRSGMETKRVKPPIVGRSSARSPDKDLLVGEGASFEEPESGPGYYDVPIGGPMPEELRDGYVPPAADPSIRKYRGHSVPIGGPLPAELSDDLDDPSVTMSPETNNKGDEK